MNPQIRPQQATITARERNVMLLVFGVIAILAAALFYTQRPIEARHRPWTGPHIGSDGWYYYHNLRSLALDGNFDLENEYRQFGNWYGYTRHQRTGKYRNPFGVGPAIAWLPAFYVGHFIAKMGNNGRTQYLQANGYSPYEQISTLTVSLVAGLLCIPLAYLLCRRFMGIYAATVAVLAATTGGPLAWYTLFEPAMPHALATFFTTAFLVVYLGRNRELRLKRAVGAGLLCGMAILMRPQLAALLLIPASDYVAASLRAWKHQKRTAPSFARRTLAYVVLATIALVTLLPQLVYWKTIYGAYWTVPQGGDFLRVGHSLWPETLFSSRNGLFVYTPVLWFVMPGLVVFLRRQWTSFRSNRAAFTGLAFVLFVVVQAYINGAVWDWWGGGAYGGRRYTACTPLFALFIGVLVASLCERVRYGRTARVACALALTTFLSYQAAFVIAYHSKDIPWDSSQPMWLKGKKISVLPRTVYRHIGSPFAFPANLVFAVRYGVPLRRYDSVAGPYLLSERLPTTNPLRKLIRSQSIRLDNRASWRQRYRGRGWKCSPRGFIASAWQSDLLIALNRPGGFTLRLHFRTGLKRSSRRDVRFNAAAVGTVEDRGTLTVRVKRNSVVRGINVLTLTGMRGMVLWRFDVIEGREWPARWHALK